MNRQLLVILSVLIVVCGATTVSAQSPRVGLYSNANASICSWTDTAPGFFQVFIVVQNIPDVVGIEFKVVAGPGFTATLVGELCPLPPFPSVIGDAFSGLVLALGACYNSPIHVYTLTFQGFGTSDVCANLALAPHPDRLGGDIRAVDCSFNAILIQQSSTDMFLLNPDGSCNSCGFPVPVEPATWGAVKALYN
jgi:hypothetical protein